MSEWKSATLVEWKVRQKHQVRIFNFHYQQNNYIDNFTEILIKHDVTAKCADKSMISLFHYIEGSESDPN